MKIGKTFYFEAAHRLQNHDGKCRGLHGHSYRVDVTVEGDSLQVGGPQDGMMMDFGELGKWWRSIEPVFDHCTLLEDNDPLVQMIAGDYARVTQFPWAPTAERMAGWLRDDLQRHLSEALDESDERLFEGDTFAATVRMWETAKSWAEA